MRPALPAAVLAVAVTCAACGGAAKHAALQDAAHGVAPSSQSRATAQGATRQGAAAQGLQPHAARSTATTGGSGATNAAGSSPTAAAGGPGGPTASATGTAGASGPAPIRPGTYTYRQSGTYTAGTKSGQFPPKGTLVVDAASSAGSQTTHRYVDPQGSPVDQTLLFRPHGELIESETLGQGGKVVCTFNPPLPAPAWPVTVGAAASGTGNCGKFNATVKEKVTGTREATVGTSSFKVFVIDIDMDASGQFQATETATAWYAPALRLVLHEVDNAKATYGAYSFNSQLTSDLVSPNPS